jgi:glycosyltransferase involved in cell wall biosynthesis
MGANASDGPFRVLQIIVSPGVTNNNERHLPVLQDLEVSLCSFSRAKVHPPPDTTIFEGDGTYRGFWRALGSALDHGPYDVIHTHAPRTAILLLLMSLGRPGSVAHGVFTVHNSFHNFRPVGRLLLFPIFALYPAVVLCSKAALESLPRPLRWLGGRRLAVVQNGVDTGSVGTSLGRQDVHPSDDGFVVVWVGRVITRKDPLTALSAFERAQPKHGRLVFVGDGEMRESLFGEIEQRGLGTRVGITGLVDREEVYRHLGHGHVYLSVSHGEGLPVAVLEAMACGVPVILSDIPPHREIAEGVDFIPLVPPGDVDGFALELRRFATMEREKRLAIGQQCKELVETRFSVRAMQRSYGQIYARVTGRDAPGPRSDAHRGAA